MGFGIAINFALWGYPTIISDLNADLLAGTEANIAHALQLFVEGELISQPRAEETLARITTTTDRRSWPGRAISSPKRISSGCRTSRRS